MGDHDEHLVGEVVEEFGKNQLVLPRVVGADAPQERRAAKYVGLRVVEAAQVVVQGRTAFQALDLVGFV